MVALSVCVVAHVVSVCCLSHFRWFAVVVCLCGEACCVARCCVQGCVCALMCLLLCVCVQGVFV